MSSNTLDLTFTRNPISRIRSYIIVTIHINPLKYSTPGYFYVTLYVIIEAAGSFADDDPPSPSSPFSNWDTLQTITKQKSSVMKFTKRKIVEVFESLCYDPCE